VLNVEQSQAQYRITWSASLPTVNANGSYQKAHANGVTADQWSASLGSTAYEVDLFGRVRSLNRQALEQYFATSRASAAPKCHWSPKWPRNISTLRQTEEQITLAKQTLQTVQDSYALNKATFDAGATSELDLRTAEGQVQTAKSTS